MSFKDYTLNYIKSTSKGIIFSLNVDNKEQFYIGSIEQDDNEMSKGKSNKCSLSTNDGIVHNMYNLNKTLILSLGALQHQYPYESDFNYLYNYKAITDISGTYLSNNLINVIQVGNVFYGIDLLSCYGHYHINGTYYDWLCRDNGYVVPWSMLIKTLLYNKDEIQQKNLSNIFLSVINGIRYNTLYEIPGQYNLNFNNGYITGTTVKCKNQYDSLYNMSHDNDYILKNARTYYGIDCCNDQIYLKFKDNVLYKVDLTKLSDYASKNVIPLTAISKSTCDTTYKYNIMLIEKLENINRGINIPNHKSELYSLEINSPAINNLSINNIELSSNEIIKENLKLEIKTTIRSLLEKITPANTQLFKIYMT